MKNILPAIRFTDIAGVGTWAMVFGLCLYWMIQSGGNFNHDIPIVSLLFAIYLICFIFATRSQNSFQDRRWKVFALVVQLASAFALLWTIPLSFLPILTIIWASTLPHITTIGRAIIITLITVILWFTLYHIRWNENTFITGMLYASFHLFAILMMHHTKTAEDATGEALQLNAELMSTRQLLSEATRQNERTRIARDLHDLLGHHLTALIINLQIANHLTEGEAKEKVEQCHSLAKLLMSDVREAVSSLRETQSLDIKSMVDKLTTHIPNLTVHNLIETDLNIEDIETAKQLLSCIQEAMTNTLKHSSASELYVELKEDLEGLRLTISDNGRLKGKLIVGNGLTGMRERIEQLNGKIEINTHDDNVKLVIRLPQQLRVQREP